MPSHYAAILVVGILILIGGPILYWVLFKMDEGVDIPIIAQTSPQTISREDITRIESELDVRLTRDYVDFITQDRRLDYIDDTTIITCPDMIIDLTRQHRLGAAGLRPWPHGYIYIGDEADACPYVLDVESGKVTRLHKGNLDRPPITEYSTFRSFTTDIAKA